MNPSDQTDLSNPGLQPQADAAGPVIMDVDKSTNSYIWRNDKLYLVLYGVLIIGSAMAIIYMHADARLLIIPLLLVGIGFGHVKARIKSQFTQQFGASIGWRYASAAGMATVSGRIFKQGRGQKISDVLTGVMENRPSRIFSFAFTVGSGKSSHTYTYTVFETEFAGLMPDITLTDAATFAPTELFNAGERIKLEGDFNKYFTLNVPKGYELEAYQIFTPDVMADLIDKARDLNFEFSGSRLYIYAAKEVTTRIEFNRIFALVTFLDGLFSKNVTGMKTYTRTELAS